MIPRAAVLANDGGFTLIEILIALVVFAIVAIGAITFVGAATTGGFLEALPTSFVTARASRDYTAASAYLHALQEFAANVGGANLTEGSCSATPLSPQLSCGGLSGHPTPDSPLYPAPAYQLNWQQLDVVIERWYWDGQKFCEPGSAGCATSGDYVTWMESTLTWTLKGEARPPLTVRRFLP